METLSDRYGMEIRKLHPKVFNKIKDVPVFLSEDIEPLAKLPPDGILICPDYQTEKSVQFIGRNSAHFLVQQGHGNFYYNLVIAAIIARSPRQFAKNILDALLVEKRGMKIYEIPFKSSLDKKQVSSQLTQILKSESRLRAYQSSIRLIADELLLNALYNAPVDIQGRHPFKGIDRASRVSYPEGYLGQIVLSFNDQTLVIGCRDPFGSIQESDFVARLDASFGKMGAQILERGKNRGGGIGFKTIIESASGLGVISEWRRSTLVFATLPLGGGVRSVRSTSKNFYLNFSTNEV